MAEEPAVESAEATAAPAEAQAATFVDLCAGTELSAGEAEAVTLRAPVHLVVLAGAAESGKTTVLASIYERLSQGPFGDFQFAGSRSLLGFEQICHLNRLVSGGTHPDTPRTVPTDEAAYYHLALRGLREGAQRRHVLLSAVSGELFRLAKNSREDCQRLTFLHRANTIVVLVDGARLATPEQRTNAQSDASSILDSFLDAQMIPRRCGVEFVFSKMDRVAEAGASALEFLEKTEEKLRARFSDRIGNLAFRRIAARPDPSSSTDPSDDGLADAFATWTAGTEATETVAWMNEAPPNGAREFSKLGWRHFARARREAP